MIFVAREAEHRGVKAAGKRERIAHRPVDGRRSFFKTPEKIVDGRTVLDLRVSLAGMKIAMVIGRGEEDLAMRVGMGRLEIVAIGQLADFSPA